MPPRKRIRHIAGQQSIKGLISSKSTTDEPVKSADTTEVSVPEPSTSSTPVLPSTHSDPESSGDYSRPTTPIDLPPSTSAVHPTSVTVNRPPSVSRSTPTPSPTTSSAGDGEVKKKRIYLRQWLKNHHWLRFDEDLGGCNYKIFF